ncbi:hypothetical protein [Romboutsia sp.]|nr:hypothetical protein [Romboutsia sp.]HSQ88844.1 hypothetical protein [Romboutsia sp.]
MEKQSGNCVYEIAHVSEKEEAAIKKAESELKSSTGKDFVVIAWEKK